MLLQKSIKSQRNRARGGGTEEFPINQKIYNEAVSPFKSNNLDVNGLILSQRQSG